MNPGLLAGIFDLPERRNQILNRGIVRELNVDTDKDNNMTLNVFIN